MNKFDVGYKQALDAIVRVEGDYIVSDSLKLAYRISTPYLSSSDTDGDQKKLIVGLLTIHIANFAQRNLGLGVGAKKFKFTMQSVFNSLREYEQGLTGDVNRDAVLSKLSAVSRRVYPCPEAVVILNNLKASLEKINSAQLFYLISKLISMLQVQFGLPQKKIPAIKSPREYPLEDCIRFGSKYELDDAKALADFVLNRVKGAAFQEEFEFAYDMFITVAIVELYVDSGELKTMEKIIAYPIDPRWDCHSQMYNFPSQVAMRTNEQTQIWMARWIKQNLPLPDRKSERLSKRANELFIQAFEMIAQAGKAMPDTDVQFIAPTGIQVFEPKRIKAALRNIATTKDGSREHSESILECAGTNSGYRDLPDAAKAAVNLSNAKDTFENLKEPIEFLEMNLTLAAAMRAEKFRITPILLLGDPGIGKTMLAMELAEGLGGNMKKCSAGGAQGAFQIVGTSLLNCV